MKHAEVMVPSEARGVKGLILPKFRDWPGDSLRRPLAEDGVPRGDAAWSDGGPPHDAASHWICPKYPIHFQETRHSERWQRPGSFPPQPMELADGPQT